MTRGDEIAREGDTGGDVTSPHGLPCVGAATPAANSPAAGAGIAVSSAAAGAFSAGSAPAFLAAHVAQIVAMRAEGSQWKAIAAALGWRGNIRTLAVSWGRHFRALSPRRRNNMTWRAPA